MQIKWNLKPLVMAVVVAMSAQAQSARAADEGSTTAEMSTANEVKSSGEAAVTELSPIQVRGVVNRYTVSHASAASRTDTPIEHIPQSIVVVPKSMIEDQGVTTLSDALRNVSNVNSIDERDANNVTFKIRGFNSATVVDGVAMPGYFPNQESLVSVDRIDVIKGPAGALFGSAQGAGSYGALGGTIAITTVKATTEAAIHRVGVRVGSYSEKAANFDFNQPLGSTFAVRLAGEVSDKNSESNGVFFKKNAFSPSLAWTPSSDTEVVLRGRYLDSTTLDYSGLPPEGTLTNPGYTLPRNLNITASGLPNTINQAKGANLQWNQRLSDAWKFSFIAAYNEAFVDQRGVFPMSFFGFPPGALQFLGGARMWDKFKTTTLSPSLTTNFQTGAAKHTVNFGVDYEKTKDDAFMIYPPGVLLSFIPVDLRNPVFPAWVEPIAPATPDQKNTYTSTVAYVQEQMDLGRLHLLGSLRHSKIDVTDVNQAWGINNISSNSRTTPRVGASFEFTPQVSTFVGYSEGIKVPTISVFSTPPKPEESKQTEVGFRLKDLGGVSATLALFDLTRKNAAVPDPANPGFSIQSGTQQSRGVDLDLRWQATSEFTGIASFTSQTATITQDTNAALVNKQLFNVPKQTARLAGRYDIQGGSLTGLGLGLGLTHSSSLPGNTTNTFFTPSATVADAQLSYKLRDMRFGLNIYNLFDKKFYVPSAYFGGGQVMPALPRTVSASASFSF
jgi:iron complex outermembrane receptor protein